MRKSLLVIATIAVLVMMMTAACGKSKDTGNAPVQPQSTDTVSRSSEEPEADISEPASTESKSTDEKGVNSADSSAPSVKEPAESDSKSESVTLAPSEVQDQELDNDFEPLEIEEEYVVDLGDDEGLEGVVG